MITQVRKINQIQIHKEIQIQGKPANKNTAICATCFQKFPLIKINPNFIIIYRKSKNIFNQEMLIFYWVKHAKGTVFIRTSQNFISSFLNSQRSSKNTEISLGNNLDKIQTLNAKDIVIGADFNKEMHLMKICQYKFTHSKNLSNHPIAKQFVSLKIYIYNLDKFIQIFRSSAQEKSFEKEQIREFNLNFANLVIQSQHIRKQTTVQDVNQDKS